MTKMTNKDLKNLDTAKSFAELEEIAVWFERGEKDLDQGLEKFERALALAEMLKKRLSEAENRIKEIKKSHAIEE